MDDALHWAVSGVLSRHIHSRKDLAKAYYEKVRMSDQVIRPTKQQKMTIGKQCLPGYTLATIERRLELRHSVLRTPSFSLNSMTQTLDAYQCLPEGMSRNQFNRPFYVWALPDH